MTREGGSIPVTLTLVILKNTLNRSNVKSCVYEHIILYLQQEVSGKNTLLLPMGCGDDGAHSQNEKLDVRNYIEGTKLLGAYLYEVSKL